MRPISEIRPYRNGDDDALWAILGPVVAAGESYAYDPATPREAMLAIWHAPKNAVYCAVDGETILGAYFMRENAAGLGSHVANAGYVVAERARGRGIAEAMCRHSLDVARARGFRAMQFNFVVSSNTAAIRVWQRCGFVIVGTVPDAFRHATRGYVAIHIMHRAL